ncbi:hypothetical protein [Streptomyces sp. NPDC047706]|uniref:hypothetical protein n=1 Tax=Streptomyces sp. NPDC047706 TaxID=3365486 RepID=UPI00371ED3A7
MTYVTTKYGHLTVYGVDLVNAPDRWPLDVAYLSLQALHPAADGEPAGPEGPGPAQPRSPA